MEGDHWEGSCWVGKGAGRTELWPTHKDPEQISRTSWSSGKLHDTPSDARNVTTTLACSLCGVHGSGGQTYVLTLAQQTLYCPRHLLSPYCFLMIHTQF